MKRHYPGEGVPMKTPTATGCLILAVVLLLTPAYAQSPEIEVVDGKISMSVTAMPLGRLMSLLDRALGTTSEVKPELLNRNISAQFTELEFNEAVRKIFQGQPLSYMIISGKGVRVLDAYQPGAATASSVPISSPFQDTQTFTNNNPIPPTLNIQAPVIGAQPATGAPAGFTMTPFGPQPTPQNVNQPPVPTGGPGQLPPALGMGNNPFITPNAGGNAGGNNSPFPALPTPQTPPAPGTLGGATPGTLGR
jgi:hypothetical protein